MSTSKTRRLWNKLKGKDKEETMGRPSPTAFPASNRLDVPSSNIRTASPIPSSLGSRRSATPTGFYDADTDLDESGCIDPPQKFESTSEEALPNLWTKAANMLRNDQDHEKRTLIDQYLTTLEDEFGIASLNSNSQPLSGLHPRQAAKVLEAKAEELRRRKVIIGPSKFRFNVEPYLTNVIKNIVAAKDLISAASSADPHASAACAGVVVILNLLIRQADQREVLFKGLQDIASIICRYLVMEAVYLSRARVGSVDDKAAEDLKYEFENNLIKLYSMILEFQSRMLCYSQRGRASQILRDTFRGDTWKVLMNDIKALDGECRAFADLITDDRLHRFLDDHDLKGILGLMKGQRQFAVNDVFRQRQIQCLKLLDTCPYRDRKDINPERVEGTCEWFVEHDLFLDWTNSAHSSLLWVSADPGCGKSVLSRFLVDHVLRNDPKRVTCFFFFKEDFPDQRTAAGAICSILRQLFTVQPGLLNEQIIREFENEGARLTESFSNLFQLLLRVASGMKFQLQCVLDALDECQEADRRELIAALSKFYMTPPDQFALKFIVTSRPYIQIERGFRQLEANWPTIHLRGEDDSQATRIAREIDIFTKSRVSQISVTLRLGDAETKFLETEVMRTENRTYLWVKVALDVVENILSFTKDNVEEILSSIPEGLDRLYERILNRSYDIVMARKLLHIVIAASRPLTLEEMAVALAISEKHQNFDDIQLEPVDRFKDTLRATCGLFVTIIDGKIYFIHQTAKEFLVQEHQWQEVSQMRMAEEATAEPFLWRNKFISGDSHSLLAQSCIWYLGLWYSAMNQERKTNQRPAFFEYSAACWHEHMRKANASFRVDFLAPAANLCEEVCDRDFSSEITFLSNATYYSWNKRYSDRRLNSWFLAWLSTDHKEPLPAKPTPLIVAASCGLETVVKSIVNTQSSIRCGPDECHRSPLWWAARIGRSEVVHLLLSSGPETRATVNEIQDGKTPLMVASFYGHSSTVRILMDDAEVQLSVCDSKFETALHHALSKRHQEIAQMLVDREETLCNATGSQMWTAFKESILNGYARISITIAKKFAPDFEKTYHKSPILFTTKEYPSSANTVECPKLGLLKSLHEIGNFDPSFQDTNHRSAVWWASELSGNLDVLNWLVSELNLEPDVADTWCQTPFSRLAASHSVAKMKVLLETGNININCSDHQNRTPLIHAVLSNVTNPLEGQQMREAVELLISSGANPNIQDTDGRTALMHASEAGHQDVVKLLIEDGASLDLEDEFGQTALMLAREIDRHGPLPKRKSDAARWISVSHHNTGGLIHAHIADMLVKAGAKANGKAPGEWWNERNQDQ